MREKNARECHRNMFIYNSLKSNSVSRSGRQNLKGLLLALNEFPLLHNRLRNALSCKRIGDSTNTTTTTTKKQCLFLYVIHMMLFYLSAAHNDGDDEKKEEKNVSRNIILKFQRQTSCEDFFSVFIQMCVREKKRAKEFLAIWLHFPAKSASWLLKDISWGYRGRLKASVSLSLNLTRHRDYQRRKILFRLFLSQAEQKLTFLLFLLLLQRALALSVLSDRTTQSLLAFSARLSRERTVKELGRSIRKISRSSCDLNRKTKRRRIIFHISCSDI